MTGNGRWELPIGVWEGRFFAPVVVGVFSVARCDLNSSRFGCLTALITPCPLYCRLLNTYEPLIRLTVTRSQTSILSFFNIQSVANSLQLADLSLLALPETLPLLVMSSLLSAGRDPPRPRKAANAIQHNGGEGRPNLGFLFCLPFPHKLPEYLSTFVKLVVQYYSRFRSTTSRAACA